MLRVFKDDGKLIVHKREDVEPVLDAVKFAREVPHTPMADSWHVARIPTVLIEQWLIEEGLTLDDREAVRDMIKRKMLSGEFAAFRVKDGTW